MLTGGEDTVARNRPVILIEIVEHIAPGIFEFLADFMNGMATRPILSRMVRSISAGSPC